MAGTDNGSWTVRLEGLPELSTDDMTLGDVELAEEVCGVPYVLLNPHASAREAKALLVVLLVRSGISQDDAVARATALNLRQLAGAFTYVPPARAAQPATGGDAIPPR